MPLYSNVNAYTPQKESRLFDADVIFASVDNILRTPPRTRLFHPGGFDPERWLFSMETDVLGVVILNDIHAAMSADPRLSMLYNASDVVTDYERHSVSLDLRIVIPGFGDRIYLRQATLNAPLPT